LDYQQFKRKTRELYCPGLALQKDMDPQPDLNLSVEEWRNLSSGEAIQDAKEVLAHQFPQVSHLHPPVVQVAPRHSLQQLDIF
jgi:hypothetical protein